MRLINIIFIALIVMSHVYTYTSMNKPKQTIAYPFGCSSTPMDGTDDVNCNMYGRGTHCPLNCVQDGNICISPYMSNIPCMPKKAWQCPMHCSYANGKCVPDSPGYICKQQPTAPYCPSYCHMRGGKCVGQDANYVCKLTWQLQCPYLCNLNTTTQCVPVYELNSICNYTIIPKCPYRCIYDRDAHRCTQDNAHPNAICEPLVYNTCSNGFSYNPKKCGWPILDICSKDGQIVYPYKFIKKYSFIKCNVTM